MEILKRAQKNLVGAKTKMIKATLLLVSILNTVVLLVKSVRAFHPKLVGSHYIARLNSEFQM